MEEARAEGLVPREISFGRVRPCARGVDWVVFWEEGNCTIASSVSHLLSQFGYCEE